MAYASKYYDSVKAHEYYMKNRELKGRRSTRKFNQAQKEKWAYAQNQLSEEKKVETKQASADNMTLRNQQKQSLTNGSKALKKIISERAKKQREKFAQECSDKVKAIREKLKNMTPEQKALHAERLKGIIDKIKLTTAEKKTKVTETSKADRKQVTDATNAAKKNITAKSSADLKNKKAEIKDKYEKKKDDVYNKIKSGK